MGENKKMSDDELNQVVGGEANGSQIVTIMKCTDSSCIGNKGWVKWQGNYLKGVYECPFCKRRTLKGDELTTESF